MRKRPFISKEVAFKDSIGRLHATFDLALGAERKLKITEFVNANHDHIDRWLIINFIVDNFEKLSDLMEDLRYKDEVKK